MAIKCSLPHTMEEIKSTVLFLCEDIFQKSKVVESGVKMLMSSVGFVPHHVHLKHSSERYFIDPYELEE